MIPEGRDDDHGFFRRVSQRQVEGDSAVLCETVHMAVKVTGEPVVVKGKLIVFSGDTDISLFAGGRQGALREGGKAHP